jgi:hypothetical protein
MENPARADLSTYQFAIERLWLGSLMPIGLVSGDLCINTEKTLRTSKQFLTTCWTSPGYASGQYGVLPLIYCVVDGSRIQSCAVVLVPNWLQCLLSCQQFLHTVH